MSEIKLTVVTPEKNVVNVACNFVALPLYDGEIGIGINHSPMIGRVGFGELRFKTDKGVESFYVDGGFVEVLDNNVSVMTGKAVPCESVDPEAAEKIIAEAGAMKANTDDEVALRDRKYKQARGMLKVASKS